MINRLELSNSNVLNEISVSCSWVAWSYVNRGDQRTKPPINPKTGMLASVADPETWGTYQEAAAHAAANGCDGIGIVLTGEEGLFAVDLDDCLDENGVPAPWIQELLDFRETYAELSPSGSGIRMLVRGKLDNPIVCSSAGVEVYGRARYVTITGNVVQGAPDSINEAPRTIKALRRRVDERRAELFDHAKRAVRNVGASSPSGDTYFSRVNRLALTHLDAWVPTLLPCATPSTTGYRVSSHDLGRDLQEDLSITPAGIKDFGVADMGDERKGGRTAIDLVIEHAEAVDLAVKKRTDGNEEPIGRNLNAENAAKAADWLCEQLAVDPWGLGKQPHSAADWVAFLNAWHAVIREGGKTFVGRFSTDFQYTPPRRTLVLENPHAFREYYANRNIITKTSSARSNRGKQEIVESEETINVAKLWLTHPDRKQYDGITFVPGGPEVLNGCVNLWTGFAVPAKVGDWSKMRWHIENVVASGDPEIARYVLNWCAFAVQHPDKPAEAALIMRGRKGTGKGTLGNAMKEMFGQHGAHINNPSHLVGNFNAHLRDTCLLFADEAYWPGNRGAGGTIKALITEPTLSIEAKGRDRIEVRNMLHIIMASNESWVVPAGADERRYAVVEVSDCKMQDHIYFHDLRKELDNGGLSAMLHDLLRIDLTGWHPRQVPATKALAEQQEVSLSPEEAWWNMTLNNGYIAGSHHEQPDWVLSAVLLTEIRSFSSRLSHYNEQLMAVLLKRCGCTKGRKQAGRNAWNLPPLKMAREAWLKSYPGTVWDDSGQTEWTRVDGDVENLHKVPDPVR